MAITKILQDLLMQHDCVVIPGFGGILKSYKGAMVHETKHIFSPPSATLSFNINLKQDDGLLIHAYSIQHGITYKKASKKIQGWVKQLYGRMENKESIRLDGIGKFYFDLESNLQFIPKAKNRFYLPAFGLPEFQILPVDNENLNIARSRKERVRHGNKQHAMLLVLPLLLMALIAHYVVDMNKNPLNRMIGANLFSSMSSAPENNATPLVANENGMDDNVVEENHITTEAAEEKTDEVLISANEPFNSPSMQYSVVLGSFKNRDNALKQQEILQQTHQLNTVIVDAKPIFYKVAIPISNIKQDAFKQLRSYQQINPDAWVFEHK